MARELGMNPKKLGKLDNADREPWKLPLPEFIEALYRKRFGKDRPEIVTSVEDRVRAEAQKKAARREAKRLRREAASGAGARRDGQSTPPTEQRSADPGGQPNNSASSTANPER